MSEVTAPPILAHLPDEPDPEAIVDGFINFVTDQDLELYPAQEEAILELLAGNNVILNTPTGSGKSLVAAAAHFAALAAGQVSVYTAPIKALVSEKFFALRRDFGAERVGMITGDARINPDAPILCCTAEILANWALRDGPDTAVDVVIADEFHYYADPQRGWAWQIPLLELPHAQFLLISATLGNTAFFEEDLQRRTGRPSVTVSSTERPVPLDFEYRRTTLHASIEELLATGRAPIYLVHFTQREATEAAQGYLSLDPLSKAEKEQVKAAIGGFRFDSPVGADLRRYLMGGIGVHHAGLLPKYRLLVEKLAQDGLLKIICGTDTLGVGVNVPIRSVLFTQLFKYDGTSVRLLSNREFAQIAGRAGRKGFDDEGTVWVQAPPHVVENLRAEEKAAAADARAGKKARKVVKKKPPERGYAHWTEDTFNRLVNGAPEAMSSSFAVNHQMVMSLLDRPGDGCAAVVNLMTNNHETRRRQRGHIRRAIAIYRSLVDADLLDFPPVADEWGRRVRVKLDLQDEFALHQPLSLWALDAIAALAEQANARTRDRDAEHVESVAPNSDLDHDGLAAPDIVEPDTFDASDRPELGGFEIGGDSNTDGMDTAASPVDLGPQDAMEPLVQGDGDDLDSSMSHALNIVTVIESLLENPGVIIASQLNRAKDQAMAEMKAAGVEYEERMTRLAEVEPPRPLKRWLYDSFDAFRVHHPWVGGDTVRPKSVVREMFEEAMTFNEYVQYHGLKRSEGVVLRYVSDVYKALGQNVPVEFRTDALNDVIEWLGTVIRQVDSSLIDEWDKLVAGEPVEPLAAPPIDETDITANARAFRVLVRNELFRWVQSLALRRHAVIQGAVTNADEWPLERLIDAMDPYWDEFDELLTDGDARSAARFIVDGDRVTQILHDPEGYDEWRIIATIDRDRSRTEGRPRLALVSIAPI